MRYSLRNHRSRAFALPTVLIASVVLLTVLAVSVTATAAVRTTLKNQYYAQLAQVAGEAGVAYAKACLAANANVPQWDDDHPLGPATDCTGTLLSAYTPVQALVVAGGGGGGGNGTSSGGAGGGGAGGMLTSTAYSVSKGTVSVTVGGGGAGGPGGGNLANNGSNGSNSSFGTLVAIGGGGGHAQDGAAGNSGGSGGGGSGGASPVPGAGGAGTAGQGNNGGSGVTTPFGGGGGGGAGGVGASGSTKTGGVGLASSISGSSIFYAGGGGGGAQTTAAVGAGGNGGGGAGANQTTNGNSGNGNPGSANTGGGGGGANGNPRGGGGGNGGSGVVVIAYPAGTMTATGGTITCSAGGSPPCTSGNTVHTFTSDGDFVVSAVDQSISCPTDVRCSVTLNGNIRSSFSVPKPTVDSDGKALTIPNTGYVEILRTSNGAVWRTYTQPSVQAAVVPDLCSGDATSARGWNAAVLSSSQDPFSGASAAQTITLANTTLNAGQMYFRKDFTISGSGVYNLKILTPSSKMLAEAYIDNKYITSASNEQATASPTLSGGCHTLLVRLTNRTVDPSVTRFTASLTKPGSAVPIAFTDATWRVSAGDAVHFSDVNFYADPTIWTDARDYSTHNLADNPAMRDISTTHSYTGTNTYPANSYAYFRDKRTITLSSNTDMKMLFTCADACKLYLDGDEIADGNASIDTYVFKTLSPGDHKFGVRLQNTSAALAYFYFSAIGQGANDGTIYSQSDTNWQAASSWLSLPTDLYSFDNTYRPYPLAVPTPTANVLVVGGGGGGGARMGGGGGGGGYISNTAYQLPIGPIKVTVGDGGGGAIAGTGQARGGDGHDSIFGNLRAIGGGGGGSDYSVNTAPPGSGGSGGGTAGSVQVTIAKGIIGQGFDGGSGGGNYYPGGGGGAGGAGIKSPGTGGVGIVNSILGTSYYWAGGGGGSGYTGNGGNGGAGGGGGGAIGTTTGGSGKNAGSPGGGGATVAAANTPGGDAGNNTGGGGGGGSQGTTNNYGGHGGSGIVVISYLTGTMTATGGTITCSTGSPPCALGTNTIHAFYKSGTFTVVSMP